MNKKSLYLISLKNQNEDQISMWSFRTDREPNEFMSRIDLLMDWLPNFWSIHAVSFYDTRCTDVETVFVSIVKKIKDRLQEIERQEQLTD